MRLPLLLNLCLLLSCHLAFAQQLPNCTHPTAFFTQKVDHDPSSHNNATFQQQYQLVSDYYKPGGPILFLQGAEDASLLCLESTILPTWAEEIGALLVEIEHRFFGVSIPSNASNPIERFQSLTLENVMADSVAMLSHIKATTPGTSSAKVIVHGGSYGGALSALDRLNYPDVFWGSIAWAAPLRCLGPDSTNPGIFWWYNYVSNTYQAQSAAASEKIKTALLYLHNRIQTSNNLQSLAESMNLCTTPSNPTEWSTFMLTLYSAYSELSQFSFGSTTNGFLADSLNVLINRTLTLSDPIQGVNACLQQFFGSSKCIDWATSTGSAHGAIEVEPFQYAQCKYFPISSIEVGNGTIFPSFVTGDGAGAATCKERFNLTVLTQAEMNQRFHISTADIANTGRILFTVNEYDPTTACTALEFWASGLTSVNRNATRMLFIQNSAHTEDSAAPMLSGRQTVLEAQTEELQSIIEWLGIV